MEEIHSPDEGFTDCYYAGLACNPARGQLPVDWERAIESFKVLDRCGVESLVVGAEREVKL